MGENNRAYSGRDRQIKQPVADWHPSNLPRKATKGAPVGGYAARLVDHGKVYKWRGAVRFRLKRAKLRSAVFFRDTPMRAEKVPPYEVYSHLIIFETSVRVLKFISFTVYCYQLMYTLFKLDQLQIPTFQFLRLYSKILHRQQLLQPMKRNSFCTKLACFQKVNETRCMSSFQTNSYFYIFESIVYL